jgi:hypothetical protein
LNCWYQVPDGWSAAAVPSPPGRIAGSPGLPLACIAGSPGLPLGGQTHRPEGVLSYLTGGQFAVDCGVLPTL